jgi:hypothetical protein
VHGGDRAATFAREKNRYTVRSRHRDTHADLYGHHRIRFRRGLQCTLFRASDRGAVNLARASNFGRFRGIAQSEAVIDTDIRQQMVLQRMG